MNIKSFKVYLTDTEPFPSEPVSVQQFVRVAIEPELVEGAVVYPNLAEDGSSGANNTIVEVVAEWKLWRDEFFNRHKIILLPQLLQFNVIWFL